jgi:hypothetical protein
MATTIENEIWKTLKFKYPITSTGKTQVSNLGRIRTYNAVSDGNILNCSIVNGYKILRLTHYTPADEATNSKRAKMEHKIEVLYKKSLKLKTASQNNNLKTADKKELKLELATNIKSLNNLKLELSDFLKANLDSRKIYFNALVHRLVAQYFLPKPNKEETIVTHINFKKLDNRATNLKWMTTKDGAMFQQKSPANKLAKKARAEHKRITNSKLSEAKVATIKKLLKEGKLSSLQIARKYDVSDMQICRIKRGENWANVLAAK